MTSNQPSAPGFMMPGSDKNQQPAYAPVQQQPGYPPYQPQGYPPMQHQHQGYPSYPQQPPPQQQQQPFPAPMQPYPGQAAQGNWMNANFQTYLAGATMFRVKQEVEVLEILIGWEQANKYRVKDQAGNQVFFVGEESACLSRICCGKVRPFDLMVKDNRGQIVMQFSRNLDCGGLFCSCICPDAVRVTAPGGQFLGSIAEECSIIQPLFSIKDAGGRTVYRIEGPMCAWAVCGTAVVFRIVDMNGVSVGDIKKEWGGLVREMFTDADTFSVTFPVNADPAIKAVLLGALFMIDFNYFESAGGDTGGGRRLFS